MKRVPWSTPFFAALLLFLPGPPQPTQTDRSGCPVTFTDVAASSGIRFVHQRGNRGEYHFPETVGSGLAWLDYDGDGWMDLYVVQSGPFPPRGAPGNDRLYRNRGDGTFQDVTERAKIADKAYGMGAVAADYDNDGNTDLFVTNFGRNILYRNRGDGTFEDVTAEAGVAGSGWSTSVAFGDLDGDGFLDLFVTRYLDYAPEKNLFCGDVPTGRRDYCHPAFFPPTRALLYRNNGDGTFRDVSVSSGIAGLTGKGLGVVLTDVDEDGRLDIYVANDTTFNHLFRNLGGMRFEDFSLPSGAALAVNGVVLSGMGVASGDLDGDGRLDLAVTNYEAELNSFYRGLGEGVFEDISASSGFGPPGYAFSGFGLNLLDIENDGDLDAFIANGHVLEKPTMQGVTYAERPFLMWNDGKGKFVERGCGEPFRKEYVGRGSAAADYDNDGDVDVAVSNNGGSLLLLRNDGRPEEWVGVKLVGKRSNLQGIGARVILETAAGRQIREVAAGGSFLSSSDPRAHFGTGSSPVRKLTIRWPSGIVQEVSEPKPGRYHEIVEPGGAAPRETPRAAPQ